MTKIKICGISRLQDAHALGAVLPDYVGFVFAQSRRHVDHEQAEQLRHLLDQRIKAVGVFVNAKISEITRLCNYGVIDLVQLHGDEDAAYIENLKSQTFAPVIKAVRVQNPQQVLDAQMLPCDYLLLDTFQKDVYGGSGKSFNWKLIPKIDKPYFLAGGICAANIQKAAEMNPYCIDLSSGAETDGIKDNAKIIELISLIRRQSR